MPSFLINPADITGNQLIIKGGDAHHIQRVLRLGIGDSLILFDGAGRRYRARIIGRDSHQVVAELLDSGLLPSPALHITLLQSLPRLDKMDLIVQKAVELGVSQIVPVISRRSRTIQASRLADKQKRWQRIALEAAKQCGQGYLPQIGKARDLDSVLAQGWGDSLNIVLWEEERRRSLKQLLRACPAAQKVVFLVGPEGGFTRQELDAPLKSNWQAASLGPRILRLETAAIAALGIIQYELGDLALCEGE